MLFHFFLLMEAMPSDVYDTITAQKGDNTTIVLQHNFLKVLLPFVQT